MENMGLKFCKKFDGDEFFYDLIEFAYLCRYIESKDSFLVKIHSLFILNVHFAYEIEQKI